MGKPDQDFPSLEKEKATGNGNKPQPMACSI